MTHTSRPSKSTYTSKVLKTSLSMGLLSAAILHSSPTHAVNTFHMPQGGTSWVEVSSNLCGGDCFGSSNSIGPGTFGATTNKPISASGTVNSYRTTLSQQIVGPAISAGGASFLWGATGGTFTLHGDSASPVSVTANMDASASVSLGHTLEFAQVQIQIGEWSYSRSDSFPAASDINFRVAPIFASANAGFSFNQAAAGTYSFDRQISRTFNLAAGSTFNLGFRTSATIQKGTNAEVGATITSNYGFELPVGYYITGDNGFDSRTLQPVPEPETYAMLLVGLGLMGAVVRRRKQTN